MLCITPERLMPPVFCSVGCMLALLYAQLKLHGKVVWNPSPLQNPPIGLRLQNALRAELLLSGRDLLEFREADPLLSDPAEAKSP